MLDEIIEGKNVLKFAIFLEYGNSFFSFSNFEAFRDVISAIYLPPICEGCIKAVSLE